MEKNNDKIKSTLKKFKLTYQDILPYIDNFTHDTRICEELRHPLTEEREDVYHYAIKKAIDEKSHFYSGGMSDE